MRGSFVLRSKTCMEWYTQNKFISSENKHIINKAESKQVMKIAAFDDLIVILEMLLSSIFSLRMKPTCQLNKNITRIYCFLHARKHCSMCSQSTSHVQHAFEMNIQSLSTRLNKKRKKFIEKDAV